MSQHTVSVQLKMQLLVLQNKAVKAPSAIPSAPKRRKVDAIGEGSSAGGSQTPKPKKEMSKQAAYYAKVQRKYCPAMVWLSVCTTDFQHLSWIEGCWNVQT